MRRFIAPITAATVAIAVGLLIASVAGAARAAEFESMQARASAQNGAAATEAELAAYKERLAEAYAQLNLTYSMLQSQDAQAAQTGTNAAVSASADFAASSSNAVAYAPVPSAAVNAAASAVLSGGTMPPTRTSTTPPPLPTRAAAPSPARAATAQYCHNDAEGKWHCEDHPW